MALPNRELMVLHLIVKRFDHAAGVAYLDPTTIEMETGISLDALAEAIDALETQGYVERAPAEEAGAESTAWRLVPTDRGVLTAMGLSD